MLLERQHPGLSATLDLQAQYRTKAASIVDCRDASSCTQRMKCRLELDESYAE